MRPPRRAAATLLLVLAATASADAPAWEDHVARLAPAVLPVRGVIKLHLTLGAQATDIEREGGVVGSVWTPPASSSSPTRARAARAPRW